MNLYNIQRALTNTFVANIGIDAAYENKTYTPVNGTPWAALYFVPIDSPVRTMGPAGSGAKNENFGFIQITLNYPLNTGRTAIRQKADSIFSNEFNIGTTHTYGGDTAKIYRHTPGQAINLNGWHRLDLTIYWRNFEAR